MPSTVPRLQFEQTAGALRRPLQHGRRMGRLVAVVVVEPLEDHRVATDPLFERVRAGADRVVERCAAGGLEVLFRLDAEHTKGDLGQERRVRPAQVELDGVLVHRRDRLDPAAVVATAGIEHAPSKSMGASVVPAPQ